MDIERDRVDELEDEVSRLEQTLNYFKELWNKFIKFLQNKGYKLLRFYNSDINKELKNTETTIFYTCKERARELGVSVAVTFTED